MLSVRRAVVFDRKTLLGVTYRPLRSMRPAHEAAIATLASGRSQFGISLPLIFGLGVYALIVSHGAAVLHDPDTYLHIAVGRWIIAHGAVPHHGIFSFTMPDAVWVAHEWLGEVVIAWLFDHFGWIGLLTATGLSVAAAVTMLLRVLLRTLAPVHATIATALACALALPHVLARPHIFTLPILVAWAAALVRARSEHRAPSLRTAPLMLLWANLHGGYMFGLGLAALLAGEAVLTAGNWPACIRAARSWGLFGAASVLAALATPFGIEGLLLPFRLTQMNFALSALVEWQSPDFQSFQPLELWILIALCAALSLGWRLPLTRVGIVLLLVHMALQHRRYGELLGFVAPLLLAPALASELKPRSDRRPALWLDRVMAELAKPANPAGIVLTGAALAALSAFALHGSVARQLDALSPRAALDVVGAHHITGPVLNAYGFGDYLIFSGIEPFIDGRAELYGDRFIKRYGDAILGSSDQLPVLLSEYGITWTLLDPGCPAVRLLDYLPGWRRLYADGTAIVHVRDNPPR